MTVYGSYANGFAPRDGQPLYPELWQGCVGAWAPCLGPTGLTLRDWSGYGNDGTLANMDAGTDWVSSQGKYAIDFDGVNDHIPLTNKNLVSLAGQNNRASVVIWVYPRSYARNVFLADWSASGVSESFRLEISGFGMTANRVGGTLFTTGGGTPVQTQSDVSLNMWHCFALVRDGGTLQLFWNGRLENSVTSTVNSTAMSNPITMGRAGALAALYANAQLDSVALFSRAITAHEIRLLASRRGIAYDLAPRRRSRIFTGGFKAYWAARKAQIIGGGL